MSDIDLWRQWAALLRSWGREVREQPGCWGKNNGLDWAYGEPQAWVNHHFVCSLNPSQDYIDNLVAMLRNGYATGGGGFLPGPVVNTFLDMNGVIYLIATGPSNHAGQGSSSVLNRVRQDKAPLGPAVKAGAYDDGVKNHDYAGTETQHPGGSQPYPDALINSLVDLNAAAAIVWGWTANRAIHHYESTRRKDDMSWLGGVNGDGGPELRRRVAAKMAAHRSGATPISPTTPTTPTTQGDTNDMADITTAQMDDIASRTALRVWATNLVGSNSGAGATLGFTWANVNTLLASRDKQVAAIVASVSELTAGGGAVTTADITTAVKDAFASVKLVAS